MNSSIELRNFAILERIGKGSFGEVYKIKNKKTGEVCAAKISLNIIDEESTEIIRDISREVNILSKINNISILKFIGFSSVNFQNEPKPVIVTEYLANGSLNDILNLERKSLADFDWNSTRKLITIYGIASAMAYLHSNNIIHRDLKPANILMDDFLCPKIADFGLSKMKHSNSETMSIESTLAIKGTPIYISPEIWKNMEYTKASDVYSFGIIIYEIITNEEPFKEFDVFEIRSKVKKGFRPPFNCPIPESYKNLIERCWSQDPEERPTFDQILNDLKTDPGFITDLIEEVDYMDYMEYVDNYASTFDPKKKIIQIDQFIKRETVTFHKITIPKKSKDSKKILVKETIPETKQQTLKEQKTKRFSGFLKKSKSKEKSIYPSNELILLDKKCQILVQEASKDAEKQFQVGQNLIEGKNGFPNNTEIGIKYLEKSTKGGCIDAVSYYCKMLIKGNVIPKDHPKAKKILKKYLKGKNGTILFLYGKIKKKEGDMMKAMKYLDKASKLGNGQAMYEIGKIFFKGINCQKDEKKAQQYFEMAKNNGFDKSESFFAKLDKDYLFDYGLKLYQGRGVPVNKKAAAKYLQMAIEKDSHDAMFLYGQMLEKGDGISPDPSKAIEYYKIAADKGNVESMYNYALMLYNGNGVPNNKKEASVYFKKAADQDDQKAIIKYSKMMYDGDGVPVNKKEASVYYKKAADKGDLDSIIKYGKMMHDGDGVLIDKKEASKYLKKAADGGDMDSIIMYGKMKLNGDGVPVDKKEASKYLKKAADNGDANSISLYKELIFSGELVDKKESIDYIKRLADSGDGESIFEYAKMLENGNGVSVNKQEALEYYRISASKGRVESFYRCAKILDSFNDPEAIDFYKRAAYFYHHTESMYEYALILKNGKGVGVDKNKACEFFKLASEDGHIDSMNEYNQLLMEAEGDLNISELRKYLKPAAEKGKIESMYLYGWDLIKGRSYPMNIKEGVKLIKMSAEKGYLDALNDYGCFLLIGEYIEKNLQEGLRYLRIAIEKNHIRSQYNYGKILYYGQFGVPVDKKEGIKYLKIASDGNYANACDVYGNILLEGIDLPKNESEAMKYIKKAADQDNSNCLYIYGVSQFYGINSLTQNKSAGLQMIRKAVEKGSTKAKYILGEIYFDGDYVTQDFNEAARLYKIAADEGHVNSMYRYSQCVLERKCDNANITEGMRYLKMACDSGHEEAKKLYEKMYR